MKAKLDKIDKQYFLSDVEDNLIATTEDSPYKRLSMKNCQAIELGYDLDELAEKEFPFDYDIPLFETLGITEKSHKSILIGMLQGTLQKGFQKALELIGDKKYSEEDVRTAILFGQGMELWKEELQINDFIQSLQQTEWDVEIEMVNILENGYKNQPVNTIGFIAEYKSVPKLDENGCLILKKI
jgi:hypothetical protein